MITRNWVRSQVMIQRPDLTSGRVDELIDDAVNLLGNLVHYRNGGQHEDEDVVTTVLKIGQDKQ